MNHLSEKELNCRLHDTPELPSAIYTGVLQTIKGQRRVRSSMWSLAAALVLSVVGFTFYHTLPLQPGTMVVSVEPVSDSLSANLADLVDYLEGNDIDQTFEQYAIVDPTFYANNQGGSE